MDSDEEPEPDPPEDLWSADTLWNSLLNRIHLGNQRPNSQQSQSLPEKCPISKSTLTAHSSRANHCLRGLLHSYTLDTHKRRNLLLFLHGLPPGLLESPIPQSSPIAVELWRTLHIDSSFTLADRELANIRSSIATIRGAYTELHSGEYRAQRSATYIKYKISLEVGRDAGVQEFDFYARILFFYQFNDLLMAYIQIVDHTIITIEIEDFVPVHLVERGKDSRRAFISLECIECLVGTIKRDKRQFFVERGSSLYSLYTDINI